MNVLEVLDYYGLLAGAKPNNEFSLKVVCPFHNENVPSMVVDLRDGRFYCFGCSTSGNMYDMIAKIEKVDSLVAMQKAVTIGKKYGGRGEIKIPELHEKDKEDMRQQAEIFFESLQIPDWNLVKANYEWNTAKSNYMIDRGFKKKTLRRFDVRINKTSNYPVIIPINENEVFKGYVCRRVDGEEPKYLYNEGFSKKNTLFGNIEKGLVMVVEGSLDRMMVTQFGFKNVVAFLGWKCSDYQAGVLDRYGKRILCGTDNDEAGELGYDYLKSIFPKKNRVVRFLYPPKVKDPVERKMTPELFWDCFTKSMQKYL